MLQLLKSETLPLDCWSVLRSLAALELCGACASPRSTSLPTPYYLHFGSRVSAYSKLQGHYLGNQDPILCPPVLLKLASSSHLVAVVGARKLAANTRSYPPN